MTPTDVEARVAEIEACRGDDEHAHALEDELYEDVLRAIARGAENPAALAKAALATCLMNFARWCA